MEDTHPRIEPGLLRKNVGMPRYILNTAPITLCIVIGIQSKSADCFA